MRKLSDDVALLLLRIAAGVIFIPHGYSKVFGEGGPSAFASDLPGFGFPAFVGYIVAYAEMFGALLLIAGLLTRLDAFLLACTMAGAAFVVKLPDALFEVPPGGNKMLAAVRGLELELALLAICVALVITGAGRFSLDAMLGIDARAAGLLRRNKTATAT